MKRLILIALLAVAGMARAGEGEARAKDIIEAKCFLCHGAEGESASPLFPRLAGQRATYVARQLADFQSGKRASTTMQPMVAGLQAADFDALGRYFESRPAQAHPVADPELAQVGRFIYTRGNPESGVPACASCHGADGHGSDTLPRLAGQHAQYVEKQLKEFNQRQRTNDAAVMQAVTTKLTALEVKAVAAYLSGLP